LMTGCPKLSPGIGTIRLGGKILKAASIWSITKKIIMIVNLWQKKYYWG
jgi:hypothetical protein